MYIVSLNFYSILEENECSHKVNRGEVWITKIFGYNAYSYNETSSSSPSYTQLQNHVHNFLAFHLALKNQIVELPLHK